MSYKTHISNLSEEEKEKVNSELEIRIEQNKYSKGAPPKFVIPYEVDSGDNVYLPFSYSYRVLKRVRPIREEFGEMNKKFKGQLRPAQDVIAKEAISYLSKKGSVILSMYPGFGKTISSIYLACKIGMKVLVIVNRLVLMKQWEKSIETFVPNAVVQRLTAQSKIKVDKEGNTSDFYIMNATNVCKMGREFFKDIGCLIVDECHLIMAETLAKSMGYIFPRYLIGLSATPYRTDGLDKLLEFYFGKYRIIRKLYRKHKVYRVDTGFVPEVETTRTGRLNWGVVLDSQAMDEGRNNLIVSIVKRFNERHFLILVKRVKQGEILVEKLKGEGVSVTSLLGTQQEFDRESRVLIGTSSKVGVGFDHKELDTLLLAGDVEEYFIQYLGRVFRTEEGTPLIFDLVDKNGILEKHFRTRRATYIEHGGKIYDYSLLGGGGGSGDRGEEE